MIPIFIGGCERSGTTMLGAMLGRGRRCICTPESLFKTKLLSSVPKPQFATAQQLMKIIANDWRYRIWKQGMNAVEFPPVSGPHAFPLVLAAIVKAYAGKRGMPTSDIWVDHTPNNIRHGVLLKSWFPDAKFIHIIRDGRAVAASVIPLDWGPNTVLHAARWWEAKVGTGLAAERYLGEDIVQVFYEELVRDPKTNIRRICDFVGIDYADRMIAEEDVSVLDYTKGQHRLVGQEPDVTRIDSWRKNLTPREIEIFELLTDDLLDYLGYPKSAGYGSKCISRMESFSLSSREVYGKLVRNRFRRKRRIRRGVSGIAQDVLFRVASRGGH